MGWPTLGLFGAWLVHDAEEVATFLWWSRNRLPQLRDRHPWVPQRVWKAVGHTNQCQVNLSVGLVGGVIAAAAVDGWRTDGDSAFYQVVLAGFGLHAISHLGATVVTRDYTPGVVTAVILVAPFSVWAWSRLPSGTRGEMSGRDVVTAVAGLVGVIAGARAVGRHVCR